MMTPINIARLEDAFKALESGYYVPMQQILEVRAQFYALGLVEIGTDKNGMETTKLTEKGKLEMQKLNTIMKQK
jgi:hypothetical protein